MDQVRDQSQKANVSDRLSSRRPLPALSFTDPADLRAWLEALRNEADDIAAVARDATSRYSRRVLSRPEARRQSKRAARALHKLIDAALRGLDPSSHQEPG